MIQIMNEQNAKFENHLQAYHLSHETNLSLPSSRLEVSSCDDGKSSFPLESNFVVDTALTNLEKVIDALSTPLSFVVPPSLSTP